jgi:hypothetical protein
VSAYLPGTTVPREEPPPPARPRRHGPELEATILWPGEEDADGFRVVCPCGWAGEPFASTDLEAGLTALAEGMGHR